MAHLKENQGRLVVDNHPRVSSVESKNFQSTDSRKWAGGNGDTERKSAGTLLIFLSQDFLGVFPVDKTLDGHGGIQNETEEIAGKRAHVKAFGVLKGREHAQERANDIHGYCTHYHCPSSNCNQDDQTTRR